MTLRESCDHLRNLYMKSEKSELNTVIRKQIFYSSIALLMEAASKYIQLLDPAFYNTGFFVYSSLFYFIHLLN